MEKRKRHKIIHDLLPAGTILTRKYKGINYTAKIVRNNKNPYRVAVEYNGVIYPSMTAAAKIITKNSVNGWSFWRIMKK